MVGRDNAYMSFITREVKSRGFSILAAVVFAALLVVVGSAVQMTVPLSVSPQSQGAEAAIADVAANVIVQKPPTIPGYDELVNQPLVGNVKIYYWPVCPANGSVDPNSGFPKAGISSSITNAVVLKISKTTFHKEWGSGDGRCLWEKDANNNSKYVPIPGQQWKPGGLTCKYPSSTDGNDFASYADNNVSQTFKVATRLPSSADEGACTDEGRENRNLQNPTPAPVQYTSVTCVNGFNVNTYERCTNQTNPAEPTPPVPEIGPVKGPLDQLLDEKKELDANTAACEKEFKGVGCDGWRDEQQAVNEKIQKMAEDGLDKCYVRHGTDNECTKPEVKKYNDAKVIALDGLKESEAGPDAGKTPGTPCTIDGRAGTWQGNSCVGKSGDSRTPPNNQPSPGSGSRDGSGGGGNGNSGFGNPSMGANPGVSSPFGGACTNRYVCQGNTLYYQTVNTYGGYTGSASCTTQPMQQCQYGCQQPQGTAQPGQQQSTLGTITQILPIITSLASLFGGGNNSATANNNLPSSCATQPPQQQSPNGTGTNGQPCTQPPQQPDPSQCTVGSWKPTSAQQNGCTTGYQCVPNTGTGTNSGAPTASLSCQPKIADVGMSVGFSFSCGNASGSTGTGFNTNGAISGNSSTTITTLPDGQNTATYTLTCVNQGVTASSQCKVQVSKPGIVLVTNPQHVKSGETATIGWITAGMQSCVISSPDQTDFSLKNASITNVNGTATTMPITKTSRFLLDCQTLGSDTRQASTTVTIK